MVVVSSNWVKNVTTTYPKQQQQINNLLNNNQEYNNSNCSNTNNNMSAKAILICRPNSHPFQERTLKLYEPVKIGRSVARARATQTNAIFDCKVLSRNHALLWYENGKFYLKDTTSSNGTFVNNKRLTPEIDHHELSSGDIVQFGVDVIENNHKITHGCIIATLKLYLPDGKEAKASPTIIDNSTHVVPMDELFKLHQIIQEASHREQCLESKLAALQCSVEEAKKSTAEIWQAYVGEERLLSRVSALETQLQQVAKNWSEDTFKEELIKLHEGSIAFETAAKETLDKVHNERLQALTLATEQERLRISAEQEVILIKEQLNLAQQELEEITQRFADEQKKAEEERKRLEQERYDLQQRLDADIRKTEKLKTVTAWLNKIPQSKSENLEKRLIYDDAKLKEELLSVDENWENISSITTNNHDQDQQQQEQQQNENQSIDNHINLTVGPVFDDDNNTMSNCEQHKNIEENDTNDNILVDDKEIVNTNNMEAEKQFSNLNSTQLSGNCSESSSNCETIENEKDDFDSDNIDSKTLKYKYQSAQNEFKKKIEILTTILEKNKITINELERLLNDEKEKNQQKFDENERLKQELLLLEQKWKEGCNESQQLKDRLDSLTKQLELNDNEDQTTTTIISTNNSINYQQFVNLEEELVVLKERYSHINDEKLKLHRDYNNLKQQYDKLCNSSYDKMYFYIAPLILMILYLVISAMIS